MQPNLKHRRGVCQLTQLGAAGLSLLLPFVTGCMDATGDAATEVSVTRTSAAVSAALPLAPHLRTAPLATYNTLDGATLAFTPPAPGVFYARNVTAVARMREAVVVRGERSPLGVLFPQIPVIVGFNRIEVFDATATASTPITFWEIHASPPSIMGLEVTLLERLYPGPSAQVTVGIKVPPMILATTSRMMVDVDGDRTYDYDGAPLTSYTSSVGVGFFRPRVLLELASGQLHSVMATHQGLGVSQASIGTAMASLQLAAGRIVDMHIDATGENILLLDTDNSSIHVVTKHGDYVEERLLPGLTGAKGFAVLDRDTLIIADTLANQVVAMSFVGGSYTLDTEYLVRSGGPVQLQAPSDVAVVGATGRRSATILVADTGNARLLEFSNSAELVRTIDLTGTGAQFQAPDTISVFMGSRIFVSDPSAGMVVELGMNRAFERVVPTVGVTSPSNVSVDVVEYGTYLVADASNGAISRHRLSDGVRLTSYGGGNGADALLRLNTSDGKLVAAISGVTNLLEVYPGTEDPALLAPSQVLNNYVAAMTSGNLMAAARLMTGRGLANLHEMVQNPQELALRQAQLIAGNPWQFFLNQSLGGTGMGNELSGQQLVATHMVSLVRDLSTNHWRISIP